MQQLEPEGSTTTVTTVTTAIRARLATAIDVVGLAEQALVATGLVVATSVVRGTSRRVLRVVPSTDRPGSATGADEAASHPPPSTVGPRSSRGRRPRADMVDTADAPGRPGPGPAR